MRAGRARLMLLWSLVFAALAVGCDWRDFDSIQNHTPVLAMGAPPHFPVTADFGRFELPLSGPPADSTGGAFVVSAASGAAVAVVNVDAAGQPHGQTVSASLLDAGSGHTSFPATAMAEVPGAGEVLLGVPDTNGGTGAVLILTLGSTPAVSMFDSPSSETRFGLGVASGALAGADTPDFVVASDSDLIVYVDGDATKAVAATQDPSCPIQTLDSVLAQGPPVNRPVLVAPGAGAGAAQIVVGTPSLTAAGSVSVFTVDATSGAATCAFSYTQAEPGFGTSLATGDFDGDGALDLLVGSPPEHAFWIRGPLGPSSSVLPVGLTAGSGTALGASVAAANLDGVPGDEALVGDPDALVGGDTSAGEIHIVGGATLGTEQAILRRYDPSSNDAFGVEVHALPFCSSGCGAAGAVTQPLVLVGSTTHAFTLFTPVAGATDPRTK